MDIYVYGLLHRRLFISLGQRPMSATTGPFVSACCSKKKVPDFSRMVVPFYTPISNPWVISRFFTSQNSWTSLINL